MWIWQINRAINSYAVSKFLKMYIAFHEVYPAGCKTTRSLAVATAGSQWSVFGFLGTAQPILWLCAKWIVIKCHIWREQENLVCLLINVFNSVSEREVWLYRDITYFLLRTSSNEILWLIYFILTIFFVYLFSKLNRIEGTVMSQTPQYVKSLPDNCNIVRHSALLVGIVQAYQHFV